MDHRTRINAVLWREGAPDRTPVTSWGHAFADEWDASALARTTVRDAKRHGWDLVKLQPRATSYSEAFGSRYSRTGSPVIAPVLQQHVITSVDAWSTIQAVTADVQPLATQVDALRLVVSRLPDRPAFQTVFSPFTIASYLAADDRTEARRVRIDAIAKDEARAVRHLRRAPDTVGHALGALADTMIDFIGASLAAGAEGIFYAIGGSGSRQAMTGSEFADLILPHDRRVLAAVPAEVPVIIHVCGNQIDLDRVADLRGEALSWAANGDGNPSLVEGAEQSGRVVVGGVELTHFAQGREAVEQATAAAVSSMKGRSDFILGPGCSVHPYVPAEVVDVMAQGARTRATVRSAGPTPY